MVVAANGPGGQLVMSGMLKPHLGTVTYLLHRVWMAHVMHLHNDSGVNYQHYRCFCSQQQKVCVVVVQRFFNKRPHSYRLSSLTHSSLVQQPSCTPKLTRWVLLQAVYAVWPGRMTSILLLPVLIM